MEDLPGANPCPLCGAPLVLRESARGYFWGCSRYPACHGTRRPTPEEAATFEEFREARPQDEDSEDDGP
jgi:ssDNA-binding Zn-finger/Zn-ribbon topoisomerase 1